MRFFLNNILEVEGSGGAPKYLNQIDTPFTLSSRPNSKTDALLKKKKKNVQRRAKRKTQNSIQIKRRLEKSLLIKQNRRSIIITIRIELIHEREILENTKDKLYKILE